MFKKILLLSFLAFCSICSQESSAIKPWVKQTSKIYIRMLGTYWDAPIEDKTIVADLKDRIRNFDGIPIEYQSLNPFWKKWWTLWLAEGHGTTLDNQQNIKQIMSQQNTNLFELRDTRNQK